MIILLNISSMLIMTFIMASLTLMESKILALMQSSVGPFYMGYKGSLQYLADALKLFFKEVMLPLKMNKFLFFFFPSIIAFLSYILWLNSMWFPNVAILDFELNMMFFMILSFFFNFMMLLTGYYSNNKYAVISSYSVSLNLMNLEFLLNFFFFSMFFMSESISYFNFVIIQENFWFCMIFFFFLSFFFSIFLIETNSSPFDLMEAESELIAGYTSEFGSFCFALFYLSEYFHLFFFSYMYSMLMLGGWNYFYTVSCLYFY